MIEQVERFVCGHCGYITEHKPTIEQIKKTGICPACQNSKVWRDGSERTRWEVNNGS